MSWAEAAQGLQGFDPQFLGLSICVFPGQGLEADRAWPHC